MYKTFRQLGETWLRIPPQPEPPPGDEASARVFRAAPKYLSCRRVIWAIQTLIHFVVILIPIGIIGTTVILHESGWPVILVGILGLIVLGIVAGTALFSLALVQLDYEKRWYLVTDRSLRIREGVLAVREITFTFANIQNLSITQGPIQRLLGIADLKVETAGGGSGGNPQQAAARQNLHTAYFRGIDNAEEVKQLIADRMRSHRDAGLGDTDDALHPAIPDSTSPVLPALQAVLQEAKALRQTAGTTTCR